MARYIIHKFLNKGKVNTVFLRLSAPGPPILIFPLLRIPTPALCPPLLLSSRPLLSVLLPYLDCPFNPLVCVQEFLIVGSSSSSLLPCHPDVSVRAHHNKTWSTKCSWKRSRIKRTLLPSDRMYRSHPQVPKSERLEEVYSFFPHASHSNSLWLFGSGSGARTIS